MDTESLLKARLADVEIRIRAAEARSGRPAGAARLIGVVKTVAPEVVQAAVALGLRDLGENRVQEAEGKVAAVGFAGLRWHMIGHLQRNKAARAVELFECVHGVDRPELAEALSRHALAAQRRMPVLIEVNVGGETSKFGVAPAELQGLAEQVAVLPGVELQGLMTVGPPVDRAEDARPGFAALRTLRDRLAERLALALPELSMGMSGDFEVAVEEGSTMVRIGSAIFGSRG